MTTTREQATAALVQLVEGAAGAARVERSDGLPDKAPGDGLIRIGEGGIQEQDPLLGRAGPYYVAQEVPVSIFARDPDKARRAGTLETLRQAIAAALIADETLGGAVDTAWPTEAEPEDLANLPAGITATLITVTMEYQAPTPLG